MLKQLIKRLDSLIDIELELTDEIRHKQDSGQDVPECLLKDLDTTRQDIDLVHHTIAEYGYVMNTTTWQYESKVSQAIIYI